MAVAGIGPAAAQIVDTSKVVFGGTSNFGFWHISNVVKKAWPKNELGSPVSYCAVLKSLRANWINGESSASDQAIAAKDFIKLSYNLENSSSLADIAKVDPNTLSNAMKNALQGATLAPDESAIFNRADEILLVILNEGYQRVDQSYRNWSKFCAVLASICIAYGGWYALSPAALSSPATAEQVAAYRADVAAYFQNWPFPLIIGLMTAPIAPLPKNLQTALESVAQSIPFFKK